MLQGSMKLLVFNVLALVIAPAVTADSSRQRAERLGNAAAGAATVQRYDEAIELARAAAALYSELGDRAAEAECLMVEGLSHEGKGDLDAAEAVMRAAVERYQPTGGGQAEANARALLGKLLFERGEHDEAARHLDLAIPTFRAHSDRRIAAKMLRLLGQAEIVLGRYPQARQHLTEALQLFQETGLDGIELADLLHDIATLETQQGHFKKARPLLIEALQAAESHGNQKSVAATLHQLGVLANQAGSFDEAARWFSRAEAIYSQLDDARGIWLVRQGLAVTRAAQGRTNEALDLLEKGAAFYRSAGPERELARALTSAAALRTRLGDFEDAEDQLRESLAIRRRIGDESGEAATLNNFAALEVARGRYDRALGHIERSLSLRRKLGDLDEVVISLANSALIYLDLGRFEEGIARLEEALGTAREIGQPTAEASVLQQLAQVLAIADRPSEGLARAAESLAISREIGDREGELKAARIHGLLLVATGRLGEAIEELEKTRRLGRDLGRTKEEAEASLALGVAYVRAKRAQDAIAALEHAVSLQRSIGVPPATELSYLGSLYAKLDQRELALRTLREAVELTETTIGEMASADFVSHLVISNMHAYSALIELLAEHGSAQEAFLVAERARGRALLRQISGARISAHSGTEADLISEERALRRQLQVLQEQVQEQRRRPAGDQDGAKRAELSSQLDDARRRYDTLLVRLGQSQPEYASLIRTKPLELTDVQRLLDEETTLIEYFILERETLAWVVDRHTIRLERLPISADWLAKRVTMLRHQLATREPAVDLTTELHRILVAPLLPHVRHASLVVVPHGVLHTLPFAALRDPESGYHLIQTLALTLLPSSSVLPFVHAKRNPFEGRILALGDPDGTLPHAAEESRAIAALWNTEPLLGQQASESALRRQLASADIIHIAAHATFDAVRPLFSRIELAAGDGHDGALEVHEVFVLDLARTNLVVLSGCNTALGAGTPGDDQVGLTRALFYAGVPAVVTTLWPVDDASSATLTASFHRHLRQGETTAGALRLAQLEIMAQEKWRSPYFWAAFTLTGDWKGEWGKALTEP